MSGTVQEFWVLDGEFEYEVKKGIVLDKENSSILIGGKRHSSLFAKDVVINVARNVRNKAQGDAYILYHRGTSIILISDRLQSALREIGATGYELLPAVVRLSQPKKPVDVPFSQLLISGWGGNAPPDCGIAKIEKEKSGVWRYSDPTDCSKIVDPEQYDGSDFFRVWPMPGSIFITNRIKNLFEEMHVKNCRFETLEKYFGSPRLYLPGMAPVPLALYFRPDRAKEVGGPHGIDWFDFGQDAIHRTTTQ